MTTPLQTSKLLRIPRLSFSPLVVVCTAVGALVLAVIGTLTVLPLLVLAAVVLGWAGLAALLAWGGIEAMAALERWFENDPRFQR